MIKDEEEHCMNCKHAAYHKLSARTYCLKISSNGPSDTDPYIRGSGEFIVPFLQPFKCSLWKERKHD